MSSEPTGYFWTGQTSAEMRAMCVSWYLEPLARAHFAADPRAQSVTLAVAQYWSDEANDAVHMSTTVSTLAEPEWSWPEVLDNAIGGEDDGERSNAAFAVDGEGYGGGDSNYINIVAFGAYCKSMCSQDMGDDEAFSPYAIVFRDGDGVRIKLVGEEQQPEYENEWNVGFNAYPSAPYEGLADPLRDVERERIENDLECVGFAARIRELRGSIAQELGRFDAESSPAALQALIRQTRAALQNPPTPSPQEQD